MANEISVRVGLSITKNNLVYTSPVSNFRADMSGQKGPTPGSITIGVGGTIVEFSELSYPGWCILKNEDLTNLVEYGILDYQTGVFYPFGELEPGHASVFKFSRNVKSEEEGAGTGTGTGTTGYTNKIYFRAIGGSCVVRIDAFEA